MSCQRLEGRAEAPDSVLRLGVGLTVIVRLFAFIGSSSWKRAWCEPLPRSWP